MLWELKNKFGKVLIFESNHPSPCYPICSDPANCHLLLNLLTFFAYRVLMIANRNDNIQWRVWIHLYQHISHLCVCVLNKTKACPCCSIRCFDFLFFLKKVVHLSKLTLVKSERCLNCFHIFSLTLHRAATSSDDRQQLALFSCQFSLIIFTTAVARKSNMVPVLETVWMR